MPQRLKKVEVDSPFHILSPQMIVDGALQEAVVAVT
jgi:hypothetical protein